MRTVCLTGAVVLMVLGTQLLRGNASSKPFRSLASRLQLELGPAMPLDELLHCLQGQYAGDDEPWLAVYGDSLTRGIFFDVASILNGSSDQPAVRLLHPGHAANYSDSCLLFERRPPLGRLKCGAFGFQYPLMHPLAQHREGHVLPDSTAYGATAVETTRAQLDRAVGRLRLSFRLKTFSWEPAFDEAWLQQLRESRRCCSFTPHTAHEPSCSQPSATSL